VGPCLHHWTSWAQLGSNLSSIRPYNGNRYSFRNVVSKILITSAWWWDRRWLGLQGTLSLVRELRHEVWSVCTEQYSAVRPLNDAVLEQQRKSDVHLQIVRETVAVYCENHMEHTDTLCGQNVEFTVC
jgi:hypothetical protein